MTCYDTSQVTTNATDKQTRNNNVVHTCNVEDCDTPKEDWDHTTTHALSNDDDTAHVRVCLSYQGS